MSSPTVSVLIPCFNLGEYLDEAVTSVLAQTFTDFEILIVDDGSTDPETIRLLDRYERPQTQVFRTLNRGLAAARNYLVGRATGRYLCALDADDKLHPLFFEKTVALLESDPSLAFVSTHLQMFGDEQRIWPDNPRCDLTTLLCEDTVMTPAMVRREVVLSVGSYDQNMPHQGDEDWDLWLSIVEAGHRGIILPDVLFYYRRRRGAMCDQCTTGQTHLDLVEYIVHKHRASYRLQVLPVLLRKEQRIAALRRAIVQLEMHLDDELIPTIERRRAERDRLRAKLEAVRCERGSSRRPTQTSAVELDALTKEYQKARDEIDALRSSISWRLTSPLRRAYDALTSRGRR